MNHDQAGFAEFYQASKDDCLRTVVASTGDRESGEDAVAEAFARAWAAWPRLSRHPAPQAWVVRTALNANVSWWRRRRRESISPARDPSGADRGAAGNPADGVIDQAIMTALRRLPARQREVVALRIFLDLDTAQTAEALGIAPGTVTAHLARAMTTLRAEFGPAQPRSAEEQEMTR